jgi:hypothetical protein
LILDEERMFRRRANQDSIAEVQMQDAARALECFFDEFRFDRIRWVVFIP